MCDHSWAVLIVCNKVQIGPAPVVRVCTKCGKDESTGLRGQR